MIGLALMMVIVAVATPQGTFWIQQQLGFFKKNNQDTSTTLAIPGDIIGDPTRDRLASLQNMILTHQWTDSIALLANNHNQNHNQVSWSSPQSLAATWLAYDDPLQLPLLVQEEQNEENDNYRIVDTLAVLTRYVAATCYFAWNGHKINDNTFDYEPGLGHNLNTSLTRWKNNTHWMTDQPTCNWYGIECEDSKRLVALNLTNNHLDGTLPPEVWKLTDLRLLDLSNNQIQGTALQVQQQQQHHNDNDNDDNANENGTPLSLEYIFLSHNSIEGTLSSAFVKNSIELRILDLGYNRIGGSLPTELNLLSNLNQLNLQHNDLGGKIPSLTNLAGSLGMS